VAAIAARPLAQASLRISFAPPEARRFASLLAEARGKEGVMS
jgi:hypothetical protein